MADAPVLTKLTVQEFVRLYEREGPFEIIDGERIPLMPTTIGHNHIADNLVWALNNLVRPNQLGKVFTEAPFVLTDDRDWVKGSRVPDVMYVSAQRYAAFQEKYPQWEQEPLRIAPDIAVEIVSPTDSYIDVDKKIRRYRQDGVKLIWVINPETRTVAIHTPDSDQHIMLEADAMLTGGSVLPGFSIEVAALFE